MVTTPLLPEAMMPSSKGLPLMFASGPLLTTVTGVAAYAGAAPSSVVAVAAAATVRPAAKRL